MKILVILIALAETCLCKPVGKTKLKDPKTTGSANDHDGLKLVVDKKQHLSPTTIPKRGEKRFRIKRVAEEDEKRNVFKHLYDPPKLFSGTDEDIPQTVLNATPGTVVTYKGIQHIWRWKETREDCFKACVYEPRILCEYYYHNTDTEKCILMVQDYRKLPVSKPPSIVQTPSTPRPEKWIRTENPKITQERMNEIVPEVIPKQNNETNSELIPTQLEEKESEVILNNVDFKVPKQMTNELEVSASGTLPKTKTLDGLMPETMPQKLDTLIQNPIPKKLDALVPETKPQILDELVPNTTVMSSSKLSTTPMPTQVSVIKTTVKPVSSPEAVFTVPSTTTETPTISEAKIVIAVPEVPKIIKESIAEKEELDTLKQMVKKIENQLTKSLESLNIDTKIHKTVLNDVLTKQNNFQETLLYLANLIKLIKEINPYLVQAVNLVDNKHEALVGQIINIDEYEHQIANYLVSLDAKVVRIDSDLKSIKESNRQLSKQINSKKRGNPKYNHNIVSLNRQIEYLKEKVKMKPALMKLSKNQHVLTEALEALDRLLEVNKKRVSHIDKNSQKWANHVVNEEKHADTLNQGLKTIKSVIKDIQIDVLKLKNPQSEVNVKNSEQARKLKSDMDVLVKSNSRLQKKASSAVMDMTHLVKQVERLRVSYNESKASILDLVEAYRKLKLDADQRKTNQNRMITLLQVMASQYPTIRSTVEALELNEKNIMDHLEKSEYEMRSRSNDMMYNSVLENPSNDKDQKAQHLLILKIKQFQTKLLQKVHDLKLDIDKVKIISQRNGHISKNGKNHKKKPKSAQTSKVNAFKSKVTTSTSKVTTSIKGPQIKKQGKKIHPARQLQLVKRQKVIQNNPELQEVKTKMKNLRKHLLEDTSVNLYDPKTKDQHENALQNDVVTSSLLNDKYIDSHGPKPNDKHTNGEQNASQKSARKRFFTKQDLQKNTSSLLVTASKQEELSARNQKMNSLNIVQKQKLG